MNNGDSSLLRVGKWVARKLAPVKTEAVLLIEGKTVYPTIDLNYQQKHSKINSKYLIQVGDEYQRGIDRKVSVLLAKVKHFQATHSESGNKIHQFRLRTLLSVLEIIIICQVNKQNIRCENTDKLICTKQLQGDGTLAAYQKNGKLIGKNVYSGSGG